MPTGGVLCRSADVRRAGRLTGRGHGGQAIGSRITIAAMNTSASPTNPLLPT